MAILAALAIAAACFALEWRLDRADARRVAYFASIRRFDARPDNGRAY